MFFHTADFAAFLAVVVLVCLAVPRGALLWILLAASYVFYGFSGPPFVLLLAGTSLADYAIARAFEGASPKRRRLGIVLSALMNFSVLGFFKYSAFAFSQVNVALSSMDMAAQLPVLKVLLPVGVSFYTFQSFAYTVDVMTGRIPACRSLPRFLLFVSWFPQLVAGPIMRASQLLPQVQTIEERLQGMAARVPAAALLFAEGWLRKAFADLASPVSDAFFRDPASATSAGAIYGIVAFGLQIYGDFSGYTRMAQGASWLFGVRLIENFNLPYTASSVRDFWRRWHISLSTWFRDYVYIPLGGNRGSGGRTYFNLVVTMLLCGLWHGANWTFLLWGALHGTAMILERIASGVRLPRPVAWFATLVFVVLAWVPFRAPTISAAWAAYGALFHGGWQPVAANLAAAFIGILAIDFFTARTVRADDEPRAESVAFEWRAAVLIACCAIVWSLSPVLGRPVAQTFIYFQF